MLSKYLSVGITEKRGRGVFTSRFLGKGIIIEHAPVIVMQAEDRPHLDKTLLHDYIFEWGADSTQCCMALGLVPIYNHSYTSNCEYIMNFTNDSIMIKTVRKIKAGEELTINYNGDWNDDKKVWFDVE